MRFIAPRAELVEVLGRACGVVPQKTPTPILTHVLVEASKKTIHVTGTDLELGIVATAAAEVKEDGAAVLPAHKIFEIVRELPDAPIEIDVDGQNRVKVSCARSRFSLAGLTREDFPVLPSVGRETSFKIAQPVLRDLIKRTAFAAAESDARAFLAGACFVVYGNKIRLVATDGHRLALAEAGLAGNFKRKTEVIVPSKALNEIGRILADEGDVEISIGGNQIVFETKDVRLLSRLIAEQFPNYEQVIPKSHEKAVKVSSTALYEAVRRASLLADQKSNAIRLRLAKDRLQIHAADRELGEAHEEVEAACTGGDLEIAFKARYVIDALRAMEPASTGVVRIEFSGPLAPATFRASEKSDYLVVIMPMRI